MLRLDEFWVWDSWVADDGERYHLFFLQAPRTLQDPGRRHTAAVIGHASSTDLLDWTYHGLALGPADTGWDDLALWTGSVVRAGDGRWLMFYTALSTAGHGILDQRIGVAASADLMSWQRVGTAPVLLADAAWYKTLGLPDDPASETWRDPFVFHDGGGWHMLVTARAAGTPRLEDGVLAHATSPDLAAWTLGPPISNTAGFGQIEVPQVRCLDGRHVLVFTCHPEEQSPQHVARWGEYCTWSVPGPSPLGPWDLALARPFIAEPDLFAAPLVRTRDGGWALIGFRNTESRGVLQFQIIDPIAVTLGADGTLVGDGAGPR